jgi:hemoglobin
MRLAGGAPLDLAGATANGATRAYACNVTAAADIQTREDCERLVRAFYTRALTDPVIGFIFTEVARLDVEAHVPRIASFWETVLLDARSYSGGAFAPHARLDARVRLRAGHFERWLWLWEATVDEHFAGPRAELAKAHARRVARAFSRRLQARRMVGSNAEPDLGSRRRPPDDNGALLTVLAPGR